MLKILQARLQQYVNRELPDVQAGFQKVRGTRDQIANICWIMEKARELQKNIYFCFIDYAKAFDCVDHNKLWKIAYQASPSVEFSRQGHWSGLPFPSQTTAQLHSSHTLHSSAPNSPSQASAYEN